MTRTFTAVALAVGMAGLVAAGCASKKQDAPAASGPSELATSFSMYASPDTLRQDGASQSQITVQARDGSGQAIRNLPLRLDIAVGGIITDFGQLSGKNIYTGADGRATALYTAPMPPADPVDTQTVVQILATPVGSDYGNATSRAVSIRLVLPGVILPPNGTPVPSFVYSPSSPLSQSDVTFDASSSFDSDGRIVSYAWNFGDGSTSSGSLVTHKFAAGGSYTVVLTVTDDRNMSASKSQVVSVSDASAPIASFTFSPTNPFVNQDVSFNAAASTATEGRKIVRYDWDFGSGSPQSGMIVGKSYDVAATYAVTLTVTDDAGKKGVTSKLVTISSGSLSASFSFSPSSPSAGQAVYFNGTGSTGQLPITGYAWDFGDGSTGTGATPSHAYASGGTYVVRLTVSDGDGNTGTTTNNVTVNAGAITASFTFSPTTPTAGQAVYFNGTGSTSQSAITGYAWDFGDSASGTGATPSHTYVAAGTYVVRLTVTDSSGNTATTTNNVAVASVSTAPVTASFTFSPTSPSAFQPVYFNGGGSSSPYPITTYAWNFGDGSSGTGLTPSHAFGAAGTYVVRLTVTDNQARTATTTNNVTVSSTAPITASFSFSPTSPTTGQVVNFNGGGSSSAYPITSYAWDFGDGTTGTGAVATASHTYSTAATYVVRLTVTDNQARTATTTNNVTVTAVTVGPITANFTFSPTSPIMLQPVNFNGSASSSPYPITSYLWDFGDGVSATTGATTSHGYSAAGTYVVRLTVTDSQSRTATTTNSVTVSAGPITASFSFSPTAPVVGQTVYFNGGGSSSPYTINSYTWDFGDGTSGGGASALANHAYATTGTFVVRLTVTDTNGRSATTTSDVTVYVGPTAAFIYSPTTPVGRQEVFFNASGSTGPYPISNYAWDFGDGQTGTSALPTASHIFAPCIVSGTTDQTFVVRLTVTDTQGHSNAKELPVKVTACQ